MAKPRNKPKRKRKTRVRQPKRATGFLCSWCLANAPYNERFVPDYYRAMPGHRRDARMCFACHAEGHGLNGSTPKRMRGRQRPTLTPETLADFWKEDVSDGNYLEAAAEYFKVKVEVIERVKQKISV